MGRDRGNGSGQWTVCKMHVVRVTESKEGGRDGGTIRRKGYAGRDALGTCNDNIMQVLSTRGLLTHLPFPSLFCVVLLFLLLCVVQVCLFGANEVSLRDAVRGGATDDELAAVISAAVDNKKAAHAGMEVLAVTQNRPMITIGG